MPGARSPYRRTLPLLSFINTPLTVLGVSYRLGLFELTPRLLYGASLSVVCPALPVTFLVMLDLSMSLLSLCPCTNWTSLPRVTFFDPIERLPYVAIRTLSPALCPAVGLDVAGSRIVCLYYQHCAVDLHYSFVAVSYLGSCCNLRITTIIHILSAAKNIRLYPKVWTHPNVITLLLPQREV